MQIRLEKTLRHLLNAGVFVAAEPGCRREIKFQFSAPCGTVRLFINVDHVNKSRRLVVERTGAEFPTVPCRRGNSKSDSVYTALSRRPAATYGIAQVAARFENILRRNRVLVTWSGAMAVPSATERESSGMQPVPIFQL